VIPPNWASKIGRLKSDQRWRLNGLSFNRVKFTSFSRHYTSAKVLSAIATRLQPLLEPGDTFVDFACGQKYRAQARTADPLLGRCLAAAWPLLGRCVAAAWPLLGHCWAAAAAETSAVRARHSQLVRRAAARPRHAPAAQDRRVRHPLAGGEDG